MTPPLAENIHIKALKCGLQSANFALSGLTDLAVFSGVGIGIKTAIRGSTTALGIVGTIVGRWASEELSARYLYGLAEHATMRAIGKSSANVAFGLSMNLAGSVASDQMPTAASVARNFVPILGTKDNFWQMANQCKPD